MSPVGSSRTFLPLALLASLLFAAASGCSGGGDGAIAVQLVYPTPPAAAPAAGFAEPSAAVRAPSYAHPSNKIRIRVLAPHFAPIEKWFLRSDGRGEVGGIPPGARIAVEVDEYDNTAVASGAAVLAAPLLGRGWHNGITLSSGEVKTVPVAMYARGTVFTVCGAPASGGSGTPGDTGDGGLDNEALLRNPRAVKAGPDDTIYVSTFTTAGYGRVRKIDRYGYISHFAGGGPHGTITPGTAAASSPIDAVSDIDIDPAGNLYLFNDFDQIVRIDNGVVHGIIYDGPDNTVTRNNLAVVNIDLVYFVNYLDPRIYRVDDTMTSNYVTDNTPYQTVEPIDRFFYPLRAPSSITYTSPTSTNSLIFADTDNNRIMQLSLWDGYIYYYAGYPGGSPFVDNIDASAMNLTRPGVVDYNPLTGKIFFVEGSSSRVLYIDTAGKVHLLAGTGVNGFSGDGGPAILAGLSDPRAIAVDSRGNAYIADYGNHAIRMIVGGALP